jgi:hypothetical protein
MPRTPRPARTAGSEAGPVPWARPGLAAGAAEPGAEADRRPPGWFRPAKVTEAGGRSLAHALRTALHAHVEPTFAFEMQPMTHSWPLRAQS